MPTCVDCGREVTRRDVVRCRACASVQRRRKQRQCASCGVAIAAQSTWCVKCSAARRAVPKPKCADCGQEIAPGGTRCRACAYAARKTARGAGLGHFPVRRRAWKPPAKLKVSPIVVPASPQTVRARKCTRCGHVTSERECFRCSLDGVLVETVPYLDRRYGHAEVPEGRLG